MSSILKVALLGSRNTTTTFLPSRDIPPLTDYIILITGAAGDLGRQTAIELFRHGRPAHIYVADLPRDDNGASALEAIRAQVPDEIKDAVKLTYLGMDLASFDSIRECVRLLKEREERLDVVICNAGIMPVSTGLTREGYEVVFGVNYLGHALLVRLLVGMMVQTVEEKKGGGRIVFVASEGHSMAPKGGVVFEKLRTECKDLVSCPWQGWEKEGLMKTGSL